MHVYSFRHRAEVLKRDGLLFSNCYRDIFVFNCMYVVRSLDDIVKRTLYINESASLI